MVWPGQAKAELLLSQREVLHNVMCRPVEEIWTQLSEIKFTLSLSGLSLSHLSLRISIRSGQRGEPGEILLPCGERDRVRHLRRLQLHHEREVKEKKYYDNIRLILCNNTILHNLSSSDASTRPLARRDLGGDRDMYLEELPSVDRDLLSQEVADLVLKRYRRYIPTILTTLI